VTAGPSSPPAASPSSVVARREALLRRLGLEPSTADVVRFFLDAALPAEGARVLDAGCGRVSALAPFRERIAEFVGVDIQEPRPRPPWLDHFVQADVCRDSGAFPEKTFDLVLSSFTVEHFQDPAGALRILLSWLRPGGTIVITTVNRGHPFVKLYLSVPRPLARPLQRVLKASSGDAHPLVGACNTPAALRDALVETGFSEIELVTTDHLARAWSRRLPAYVAGIIGDLATHSFPARRSTIVARALRPR